MSSVPGAGRPATCAPASLPAAPESQTARASAVIATSGRGSQTAIAPSSSRAGSAKTERMEPRGSSRSGETRRAERATSSAGQTRQCGPSSASTSRASARLYSAWPATQADRHGAHRPSTPASCRATSPRSSTSAYEAPTSESQDGAHATRPPPAASPCRTLKRAETGTPPQAVTRSSRTTLYSASTPSSWRKRAAPPATSWRPATKRRRSSSARPSTKAKSRSAAAAPRCDSSSGLSEPHPETCTRAPRTPGAFSPHASTETSSSNGAAVIARPSLSSGRAER